MRKFRPGLALVPVLAWMLSGCGDFNIAPYNTLPDKIDSGLGSGSPIAFEIVDDRPDKQVLGVTQDIYHQRIMCHKPIQPIILDAFRKYASAAGYFIRDDSPVTCHVRIVKVELVWMAAFNSRITAEVVLDVSVSRDGRDSGYKRISDAGWAPNEISATTEVAGAQCLSVVIGRAVGKALTDPSIVAMLRTTPGAAGDEARLAAGPSAPAPSDKSAIASRWAVVIGISQYANANERLPSLKYADKDAEAFAGFLQSPAGGSFAPERVKLLTEKGATKQAITDALFEFLKHTVKEDLVVIYFSGHGVPDPDKPSNLYLLAYDSDPRRIASTGFPMWDLDTALRRTIAAERVVVLADACHSAGVTEGIKGVKVGEQFNTYLSELAKAKPGRVMFTSCEGYEVSREGDKWGGGHGVFTWAMLEALGGKADTDKNGIVTLGELLDYVDITVRRETANEQHPSKAGTQFDRSLPMGVVK